MFLAMRGDGKGRFHFDGILPAGAKTRKPGLQNRARNGTIVPMTGNALAIHQAYIDGDISTLKSILAEQGGDFPHTDSSGENILEYAIYHAPFTMIGALVAMGADVGYESDAGFPSIIAALTTDRDDKYDIVQFLVNRGADIDQRGINDWTPLHYAANTNDWKAVALLLELGADADAQTGIDDMLTPLEEAEAAGSTESAEILRNA